MHVTSLREREVSADGMISNRRRRRDEAPLWTVRRNDGRVRPVSCYRCERCAPALYDRTFVASVLLFLCGPDPTQARHWQRRLCSSLSARASASHQPHGTITSHSHVPMTFFQLDLTTEQHYQHHGYS